MRKIFHLTAVVLIIFSLQGCAAILSVIAAIAANPKEWSDTVKDNGGTFEMFRDHATPKGNEKIRDAQRMLKKLGFDPGPIDGINGENTKNAVRQYRAKHNLGNSGSVDDKLLAHMSSQIEKLDDPHVGSRIEKEHEGPPIRGIPPSF